MCRLLSTDTLWICRSRRRRGLLPEEGNSTAPAPETTKNDAQQRNSGRRSSVSGESRQSATSTPRESDTSVPSGTSSRSLRDTALRLEPGAIVCFISSEGQLMGVKQRSESRELFLLPVTSPGSVQAGSSTRMQHFPASTVFLVGNQVCILVYRPSFFAGCCAG